MSSLPRVATNIHVFCKKCDTERYFKVITHKTNTTAKLKCEVCGSTRTLTLGEEDKLNKPVPKKPGDPKVPKVTAAGKAAAHWLTLKEQYKGPGPVDYSMTQKFDDKQSLNHPTFGLGFITKSLASKIEVVFSDGVKELLHCRK